MPTPLTRRTLLAGVPAVGLAIALPGVAQAADVTYGLFRVVRRLPGEPSRPEITLPEGYDIVPGATYSVASRAEFYTVVRGPKNAAGIEVQVRWPNTYVEAVIHQELRPEIRRDRLDRYAFTFSLPMTQPSIDANQPTLQVWSFPDDSPGMNFRIEHNDPDRVAGPFTSVAWPTGEVRSVVHQLIASHAILMDSGMVEVAAAKGHRFVLMGFETNNTLHNDNPPHWHISYNSGPDFNAKTHNPHLWLDTDGRTFYNGMDVTGMGRLKYYVGDPAPIYDFVGTANGGRGNLVITMTLREDGGIDFLSPEGRSYAIAAGRDGTLLKEVTALRAGEPWLRIATHDDVRLGRLDVSIEGLQDTADTRSFTFEYDRLTGVLKTNPL